MELKLTDFDKVIILLYLLIGVPILYMEFMKYLERVDCVNWCQEELIKAGCSQPDYSELVDIEEIIPKGVNYNIS